MFCGSDAVGFMYGSKSALGAICPSRVVGHLVIVWCDNSDGFDRRICSQKEHEAEADTGFVLVAV